MEISFACKRFSLDQVLKCSFGLTRAEYAVLKALLRRGESSADVLAKILGKDRTTVQRALASLVKKQVVKRRQYNLSRGGYQYYYRPERHDLLKERVEEQFRSFSRMVWREIEQW